MITLQLKNMIDFLLKFFNPQYLIILGAVISIGGGYLASIKSDRESTENGEKVELIQTLSTEIKNLSKINKDFAVMNADYSRIAANELEENKNKVELIQLLSTETRKLSEINNVFAQQNIKYSKNNEFYVKQIQEKANETIKQVTGGDSYVLFDVSFSNDTENKIYFNVENLGDVKLENITIEIWDTAGMNTIDHRKEKSFLEREKFITKRFYSILYPKSPIRELDFKLDESLDQIYLGIDIKFGNRHLNQYIDILNYKNREKRHADVKVIENNKVIQHYTFGKSGEPTYIVK